ncbi:MAG: 30S ribosomal protein S16 [Candidatus Omnitrophota bacterium]
MEVCIRLQRSDIKASGKYNFRIVAIPKSDPRQSKALEILGYYDSSKKPAAYDVKIDKLEQWIAKGAQMSPTVKSLFKKARIRKNA